MLRDTSESLREITTRRIKFGKEDVKALHASKNLRMSWVCPVACMGEGKKSVQGLAEKI